MVYNLIQKTFLFIVMISAIAFAQQRQMKIIGSGDVEFVPEIKGLVQFENDKLKISSLNLEISKQKKIDLKENDEVLYINGKRVKNLKSFKENYEATEIGKEVKLGIKRGDEKLIATFTKQDPSKFKHKIMRMDRKEQSKEKVESIQQKEIKKKK